jgi:fibronectin-binding autotransporter adhesin
MNIMKINSAQMIQAFSCGRQRLMAIFVLLSIGIFSSNRLSAVQTTNDWNATNGVSADIYWTDPTNWSNVNSPAGIPGTGGNVAFGNNGGTLDFPVPPSTGLPVGSVLSVLGGGPSTFTTNNLTCILTNNQTIQSLIMYPTNTSASGGGGMQNLQIATGATLTVQGTNDNGMGQLGDYDNATTPNGTPTGGSFTNENDTMYVGRQGLTVANGNLENNATQVTISGGGTLFLNDTNNQMQVRDCNSSGGTHPATLDMSALANFRANLARVKFAMGEQNTYDLRAACIVYLAQTNTFILGGTNNVGNGSGELANFVFCINPENAGNASQLYWGMSNGVFADTVLLGGRKSGGCTNAFNPAIANPNYLVGQPTPSVYFRNSKGGPVSSFAVGDEFIGDAGTASSAWLDLSGGIVNLWANTLILGRGQNQGGGAETVGMCKFGDGVINVNTLQICSQGIAPVNDTVAITNVYVGTQVTVSNSLQVVVPFSTAKARTATIILGNDANNNPATLTTLGTVSTGYITEHNLLDSAINYDITNSFITMISPQPFEASTLVLQGGAISNASYILITGNANSASLNNSYGDSMTILDNGQILGAPIFDMGVRTANWDISGIGGPVPGSLVISNELEGIGTIDGSLVQAPGATIQVGEGTAAGTLAIVAGVISNSVPGNLTLNKGSLSFGLSASGTGGGNDTISVQGTLNLVGTNAVNLTALGGSFDTANPYTLIGSGSALPVNGANYFQASGALGGSRYTLTFDTTTQPNNVLLHVGGAGPQSDTWVGGLNGNAWDVKTTANWSSGQFYDLDNVTFNDAGSASPAINTSGFTLIPGSITVNNTNKNYIFGGTGAIQDDGMFTANGVGSITFTNGGGVAFQDTLTIASNAVTLAGSGQYVINGDQATQVGINLNGGSITVSGNSTLTFLNPVFQQSLNINAGNLNLVNSNANVFNGSTLNLANANSDLVFGQPANVSALCDAAISGSGQVIQNGPGLVSLSGANSGLGGVTLINGGTLQIQQATSAGNTGVQVASGGTLDLFGNNLSSVPVTASGFGVGGQGAVVSSGGTGGGLQNLTLLANTSIGGVPAWTFDPVQNRGLTVMNGTLTASSGVTGYNLNKVGNNELQFSFGTVDPLLANIDVQGGMLYLGTSGGLGNANDTITAESGATIALASISAGPPTKNWILKGDGSDPTLLDYGINQSVIAGPVTLVGACIMNVAPAARVNNGNLGTAGGVEIQGPISGSGSFNMLGSDTWGLAATNTYIGNTIISGAGTLQLIGGGCISNSPLILVQNGSTIDVSQRSDQTLTLSSGQTLTTLNGGNINGNLTNAPGATLEPGGTANLDILSVHDVGATGNVTLLGVTEMKLEPALYGSGMDSDELDATNDATQTITYGGTLQLSNFGGVYAVGQTYQLFIATNYAGAFTNISPAQPGSGLSWNTNALATSGTISIAVGPVENLAAKIIGVSVNGSTVNLSGNGGGASGGYYVLTSTNLLLPLPSWKSVATNNFAGDGSFNINVPEIHGAQSQFYLIESY